VDIKGRQPTSIENIGGSKPSKKVEHGHPLRSLSKTSCIPFPCFSRVRFAESTPSFWQPLQYDSLRIIGCAVDEIHEHFDLFEIEAGARPATQGPQFQIPSRISHIHRLGAAHCAILSVLRHVLLFRFTVWAFSRYLDVILFGRGNLLDRLLIRNPTPSIPLEHTSVLALKIAFGPVSVACKA